MRNTIVIACALLGIGLGACAPMGPHDDRGAAGASRDCGFARPGDQSGGPSGAQTVIDELETQLSDTVRELHLSPKQLVLWERYQDKVSALMSDLVKVDPYRPPHQTALRQIDAKVDTVRNRLAAMEDLAEAARQLYQSLDEDQKKVADRKLPVTVPTLYSGLLDRPCGQGRDFPPQRGREGRGTRGGMGGSPGGPMGRF